MASSNQVSWQSAYWPLSAFALNSMLQPAGKICGFDEASLRVYLRSSPIVCAMDALFIIIRFVVYIRHGHSLSSAAWKIVVARGLVDENPEPPIAMNEISEPGNVAEQHARAKSLSFEKTIVLLYIAFMVGVMTQFVKLMACSGVPWTKVWACCYVLSFLVVEAMRLLGPLAKDVQSQPIGKDELKRVEAYIEFWEDVCGKVSIVLQLAILATVDMKAIPPDPVLITRWIFICVRFSAHFAVCLVHVPFIALRIEDGRALAGKQWGLLLLSILVPYFIIAGTQGHRFSQLYFIVSLIISYFSWTLYFFPWTKVYMLFCEPEDRGWEKGRRNVLAFDLFCRMLYFSVYWYAVHYNPNGTVKPQWTNVLG